jgi:hypothetical protein
MSASTRARRVLVGAPGHRKKVETGAWPADQTRKNWLSAPGESKVQSPRSKVGRPKDKPGLWWTTGIRRVVNLIRGEECAPAAAGESMVEDPRLNNPAFGLWTAGLWNSSRGTRWDGTRNLMGQVRRPATPSPPTPLPQRGEGGTNGTGHVTDGTGQII